MDVFLLDIDIISVGALIISDISMIFSVIFSYLQMKHNKNSVRPISAIKICDYEDCISVSIDNVGTGPLLINRLRIQKENLESSNLISLMPKINQLWTTFSNTIDGKTIPVGGKISLIELNPDNEEIKRLVRRELSKITIYLEYTDIYNTKFNDKQELNFFGRHS